MIIIGKFNIPFIRENIRNFASALTVIILVSVLAGYIQFSKKTVYISVDGKSTKVVTLKGTVGKLLKNQNIILDSKDKVDKPLDSKIVNNETINIKRAVAVKVNVDGKELTFKSAEDSIASMLKAEKISLNSDDKVSPEKSSALYNDMSIDVVRVETKSLTETVSIDFKTIVKNDNDMPEQKTKVIQNGQNGEKNVTTKVVYENGKEVSRSIESEKVTKQPVDKIIAKGTLPTLALSRGGDPIGYTSVLKVKATAYQPLNGASRTYTSSGMRAVRDPDGYSTIAVDPNVIPFGTRVYVEGYGLATAADEGTAIIGNTIDVFFDTYAESSRWGVKYVNVYILK